MNVTVTVDLARTATGAAWHVLALPAGTTLCGLELPDMLVEQGVDAHVVSLKGRVVCSRCRRKVR